MKEDREFRAGELMTLELSSKLSRHLPECKRGEARGARGERRVKLFGHEDALSRIRRRLGKSGLLRLFAERQGKSAQCAPASRMLC